MKHSDVEELARKVELIEPSYVWDDLPTEYRQALCSFASLLLEKAAQVCDGMPYRVAGARKAAQEIRAMATALQSGDRG